MSFFRLIDNIGRMYTPMREGDKTTVKMVEDAMVVIRVGGIVYAGEKKLESLKVPPLHPPRRAGGRSWIPAFAGMTRKGTG